MRGWITFLLLAGTLFAADPVRTWEGTVTVPTYQHTGREMEPPLFGNSTVTGLYPFPTFLMPFKAGGPKPYTYRAIFVENEYLKLTYIPEFGGRIFSLYDKLRSREVFYRNDVIKPAPYNPRLGWPQSGLELTGPYDVHMLTLHGEPFWANQIVRRDDGALTLVLGEIDPVFGMDVTLSATLHPGIAALEIAVSCYNGRDARMPQMLWINTAVPATPKTRFLYPMTRTVGHTTADIADWPLYNGIDFSWDRNNQHMLGVFGIDIYDNFQGAYQFENDYGVFRYADRRIVQGMKLWTFGYGEGAKGNERGYTDNAGPYVELQSGRYVWDGHYEWVAPHKTESWSEWWIPVAQTGGLTTLTRDIALHIDGTAIVAAATRPIPSATVELRAADRELFRQTVDLKPETPFRASVPASEALLTVIIRDSSGNTLLEYRQPAEPPGRKEYTPFTKPLESPRKATDAMSVEELAIAAEFKFKELDSAGARALLDRALQQDPGNSRAHLLLGIDDFRALRPTDAIAHLEKTIARDPYSDTAYYYLAMAQFAAGREREAERNLYCIWADSAFYGDREYHLGRLAMLRKQYDSAARHFQSALNSNANDLLARQSLAAANRLRGDKPAALREITALEYAAPTSRIARAERWFAGDAAVKPALVRLLGGQSQEALAISTFYRDLGRWDEAARVLKLVQENNHDPWGTPPEFGYTLAFYQQHAGDAAAAAESRKKARALAPNIDRFPYRQESEAPLAEAVQVDPNDTVARFALGELYYFEHRPADAIRQWEAARAITPDNFSVRRALGLAYAEQGRSPEMAAAELERAVDLNPAHVRTRNDLSALYARAGQFDKQLAVLEKALAASPGDDDLTEAVFTTKLIGGQYDDAARLIDTHRFAPRHRSYGLRDKYRMMRYAMGAQAFGRGDYKTSLSLFESAMRPPESLGVDDFAGQTSPRQQYYRGLAMEKLGRTDDARKAFQAATSGVEQLSGDRDSWSADNFFMVFSLAKLGQKDRADALRKRFENFALTETEARNAEYRARARYLLALIRKYDGRDSEARTLLRGALDAEPDYLAARLEERKDVPDPLGP